MSGFSFNQDDDEQNIHLENNAASKKPDAPFNRPKTPPATVTPSLPTRKPPGMPTPVSETPAAPKLPQRRPPTANVPPAEEQTTPSFAPEPDYTPYTENPLYAELTQRDEKPITVEPTVATPPVLPNTTQAAPITRAPRPVPHAPQVQDAPVEAEPQKKSFWAKPDPKPKKGKDKKTAKEQPVKDYAGARKKILYVRAGVIIVALIIGGVGLKTIFLPASGPSPEQVDQRAQAAVNYTGFPTQSGTVFAQQFVNAFYTFSTTEGPNDRADRLQNYVTPDLLAAISITYPTREEYDAQYAEDRAAGVNVPEYDSVVVEQNITGGPFVVAANNLSETNAVYTVKYAVNNGSWQYVQIPVKYDPKDFSLTLAGPPSFTKPIQNTGEVEEGDYNVQFDQVDTELATSFTDDLQSYLTAWAASDDTIIGRYTAGSATPDAKLGLQGTVDFSTLTDLEIEAEDTDQPQTATQRRAEFTVTWSDPNTNLRYSQQYRMLLVQNADEQWVIYDIQNFDILNDHS